MTIRAYGVQKQFENSFLADVDRNGAWWNAFIVTTRWLGLRLDLMCSLLILGSVSVAIILKDQVDYLCIIFSWQRVYHPLYIQNLA